MGRLGSFCRWEMLLHGSGWEQWWDSRCTLEAEPAGFADGSHVGEEMGISMTAASLRRVVSSPRRQTLGQGRTKFPFVGVEFGKPASHQGKMSSRQWVVWIWSSGARALLL